jgi:hypothetical protein
MQISFVPISLSGPGALVLGVGETATFTGL